MCLLTGQYLHARPHHEIILFHSRNRHSFQPVFLRTFRVFYLLIKVTGLDRIKKHDPLDGCICGWICIPGFADSNAGISQFTPPALLLVCFNVDTQKFPKSLQHFLKSRIVIQNDVDFPAD